MRLHSIVLCVILLLLVVQPALAREADKTLSHFRVILKNGEQFEGRLGLLTENLLIGRSESGHRLNIERQEILTLESRSGSHGGTGALIGVCVGFFVALGAEPGPGAKRGKVLAAFGGSMVLGAVVGGAIGASFKKWERVSLSSTTGWMQQQSGAGLVFAYHF